jgi:UDP-glucose 4-epimerase
MRVAVTGGAGYIGSVVTEALIRERHDVLVLDNLSKGHRDAITTRFVEVDLIEQTAVTKHLREFACEAVIHLAADSLVGESVADPEKYYRRGSVAAAGDARCRHHDAGVLVDRGRLRRAREAADRGRRPDAADQPVR